MDGGASNSCPAEWKSRNINFDFYKIKRDLFTGRPMRWLTSQRVSIGRSWVKSDSLQNPLHSTGGSSWLRCRTSFPPPAEIFFLYFHHLFFGFSFRFVLTRASDWKWKATRPRHRLLPEKNVPPITQVNSSDFPRHLFFFTRLPVSLSDGSLSLNRQFCSVCSACIIRSQKLSLQRPGDEYIIII